MYLHILSFRNKETAQVLKNRSRDNDIVKKWAADQIGLEFSKTKSYDDETFKS